MGAASFDLTWGFHQFERSLKSQQEKAKHRIESYPASEFQPGPPAAAAAAWVAKALEEGVKRLAKRRARKAAAAAAAKRAAQATAAGVAADPVLAGLSLSAMQAYNQFLTLAGRALTKHPALAGFATTASMRAMVRTDAAINQMAAVAVNNILLHGTRTVETAAKVGRVIQYRLPSGWGARWYADTLEFVGFIDP